MRSLKRQFNIRYFKEQNYYTFTINKRIIGPLIMAIIFDIDSEVLKDTLVETYHADKLLSHRGIKYIFKTKNEAKNAVEWLRTLLVAKQMCK